MRKFIIWILLCAVLIVIGVHTGFREDSFLMGMLAAAIMWIPAIGIDEALK